MIDAVYDNEVLIAVQREFRRHQIHGVTVVALGVEVGEVGRQTLRHRDLARRLLIIVLICIFRDQCFPDGLEMCLGVGQHGRFVGAVAAGDHGFIGIGLRLRLRNGRHAVQRRTLGYMIQIIPVGIRILCLRDPLQEREGVCALPQAHPVGLLGDRHDVYDAVLISGAVQCLQDPLHGILIRADHDHRLGVEHLFAAVADIGHVDRIADGAEDRMIQTRLLIADTEHARDIVVAFARLILGKHDVVDEGIVFALARKRCDQDDHLVLAQLVFPPARGEVGIGRCVFHRRVVIRGRDLIRPAETGIAQRGVLLRRGGKAEHHIGRARVVAEAAQQPAL